MLAGWTLIAGSRLEETLTTWRGSAVLEEASCASNFFIEERISAHRYADAEAFVWPLLSRGSVREALTDYYRQRTFFDSEPATFGVLNSSAMMPTPSHEQKLVRIERLDEVLAKTGSRYEDLENAIAATDGTSKGFVRWFIEQWNTRADIRRNPVSYAAFRSQILDKIDAPSWPDDLRDLLGLAHYDAAYGEIPVALMEYSVGDVDADQARTGRTTGAFYCPTCFDGSPYAQFFPTPRELGFGCPMPIPLIRSEKDLIAEMVHPRLTYQAEHLVKVGVIRSPVSDIDLREARNSQLLALRLESSRDDFGEEL